MTMRDPHNDSENDRDRGRRDWLILLVLLLGFACLLIAAQMAVRQTPLWQAPANMLSKLNPDEDRGIEEVKIEPLRPEVMTPPPWDPDTFLTPVGTPVAVPTTVLGPPPAGTATPGAVAAVTPSPSPTATAPTPSSTPTTTPMPTATPVPTASPTPTPTPTTTTTPTPTPTGTPVPPTDTPVPPPTYTPTPTPTDTPIPTPPPSIFSITPDHGENTAEVPVIIQGANFFGLPTAQLGNNVSITITAASADTLTGTVPSGLTPGVYALIVTNPDAQFDVLSPAYTALNPPSPNTTLDLDPSYLSTFGHDALGSEGDDDHVQLIFFAVPSTITDSLYFRIFDADTGGGGILDGIDVAPDATFNTTITYTLRGYTDTYSDSNAHSHNPNTTGINSGTLLTRTVINDDATYHDNWDLVFGPYPASAGELAGGSRVFKLAVEGGSGDDGNRYNVALSTISTTNTAPAGSRVFAYSWTFLLTSGTTQWLYPYVPSGISPFEQHNWDMDNNGTVTLHTPMRDGIAATVSGDGSEASSSHTVQAYEDGATWTVTMGTTMLGGNDLTFWAVGDGSDLPIFTRPTTSAPP